MMLTIVLFFSLNLISVCVFFWYTSVSLPPEGVQLLSLGSPFVGMTVELESEDRRFCHSFIYRH